MQTAVGPEAPVSSPDSADNFNGEPVVTDTDLLSEPVDDVEVPAPVQEVI